MCVPDQLLKALAKANELNYKLEPVPIAKALLEKVDTHILMQMIIVIMPY